MKQYENLLFENENGIGIITINRPTALNALNSSTIKELDHLLDVIESDSSVKVVIITGSGSKAFVAGADIPEMRSLSAIEGRNWVQQGQRVFSKIENLTQPVIAAVNGFALGGGCELAMACDIRIVSEKAKFGQPEVTLGIIPGFGGTQRLPRLIGRGRAKELLFTGELIDAAEAYRIGLANKLVKPDELMNTAKVSAQTMMLRAPFAVQMCKVAINRGIEMDIAAGAAYEAELFGLCCSTEDKQEGMNAFIEKRKSQFNGH